MVVLGGGPSEETTRGGLIGRVLRIGGQVRGPDVVELMIDDEVEALDVKARPGRGGVDVVELVGDVAQVQERLTAHRGVLGHVDLGAHGVGVSAHPDSQSGHRQGGPHLLTHSISPQSVAVG